MVIPTATLLLVSTALLRWGFRSTCFSLASKWFTVWLPGLWRFWPMRDTTGIDAAQVEAYLRALDGV